ncbi:MAG: malate dehydrogenase, partial [Acidobacteria bacterium]
MTAEATRTLKESDAVSIVRVICRRFHAVVVQLQSQQRQALQINNEYDVQDILHALLELHFNNVRAKQPTPSFRGELSRTDFLLKNGQIVVEAKITRATLA